MVPKLGGRAKDGRGRSFKGLFRYVLGDKDNTRRSRRVAWAMAINCAFGGDVRRAWFEMLLIWEARAALKQAAGIPLTGRDNERPALHLTLSRARHEHPDRREMLLAAMEALWTSPEKVEGFSDRFCESEEQEWASQRRPRDA